MHGAPRILLCGDVLGHANHLFKRFHTVNRSSGPFDALLCVGQFFPETTDGLGELMECIEGCSPVPIPTYFTGDYGVGAAQVLSKALLISSNQGFKMDEIQICDNLFCVKGSGKFTLHGSKNKIYRAYLFLFSDLITRMLRNFASSAAVIAVTKIEKIPPFN